MTSSENVKPFHRPVLKVCLYFFFGKPVKELPCGISEPKKRRTVFESQGVTIRGDTKVPVLE